MATVVITLNRARTTSIAAVTATLVLMSSVSSVTVFKLQMDSAITEEEQCPVSQHKFRPMHQSSCLVSKTRSVPLKTPRTKKSKQREGSKMKRREIIY